MSKKKTEEVNVELVNIEQQIALMSPKEAELKSLVSLTKDITAENLEDPEQMDMVSTARKELKHARVELTNQAKSMRDNFTVINKAIRARELELIGIVEPEEERLKSIEQEAKNMAIRKERLARLPKRKERLSEIGDDIEIADSELLDMDSQAFEDYVKERAMAYIERLQAEKQAELDKKQEELRQKEAELENELKARDREEQARKEEREKMEREQKEAAEREATEKIEAEKRAKEEEKAKEKEKAQLLRRKKYVEFRAGLGYTNDNKDDFKEETDGNRVAIWKKVGEFDLG